MFQNLPSRWTLILGCLMILNCILLWRDYNRQHLLKEKQNEIFELNIEVLRTKSELIFGAHFIPRLALRDSKDKVINIPFTREFNLLLFFSPADCRSCLEDIATFDNTIKNKISTIGVAVTQDVDTIKQTVDMYNYTFPVYRTVNLPFRLPYLPFGVVIDRNRNVIMLSEISAQKTAASFLSKLGNVFGD